MSHSCFEVNGVEHAAQVVDPVSGLRMVVGDFPFLGIEILVAVVDPMFEVYTVVVAMVGYYESLRLGIGNTMDGLVLEMDDRVIRAGFEGLPSAVEGTDEEVVGTPEEADLFVCAEVVECLVILMVLVGIGIRKGSEDVRRWLRIDYACAVTLNDELGC